MKYVIAFLLAIIAVMAFFVGSAIFRDMLDDADSNGGTGGTDAARPVQSVSDSGADYVSIAVSFSGVDNYELIARTLMSDGDEYMDGLTNGVINFAVSFDDETNTPFTYSIPVPEDTMYSVDDHRVATFVFSPKKNANPSVAFFPGQHNVQNDNTHLYATYFVAFDDVRDNNNPHIFTIPVPDDINAASFAATFIITFGNAQAGANQFMSNIPAIANSASGSSSPVSWGGSITVEADENLMASLLGTWVYKGPRDHVEVTFTNDWRYYEISYGPSGRPLSWESGVYSITCTSTITIQSSTIWGPTYTYNFKINNNTLTFPYRGVNYHFTRQNWPPILSLENYPYAHISGVLHDPYWGVYRGVQGSNSTEVPVAPAPPATP